MKTYNSFIIFLCSLMAIEIPDVYYHYKNQWYDSYRSEIKPFEMDEDIKSLVIPDENSVYLNLDCMDKEMDVYMVLAHEIRHCAQYQATEGIGLADIADRDTIYQWKKEFSQFSTHTNDMTCQEVELDAIAFTWFIGRVMFGEEIKLNCDEILVKPYKKYICRNYSLTEIKERLDYSGFELGQTQA